MPARLLSAAFATLSEDQDEAKVIVALHDAEGQATLPVFLGLIPDSPETALDFTVDDPDGVRLLTLPMTYQHPPDRLQIGEPITVPFPIEIPVRRPGTYTVTVRVDGRDGAILGIPIFLKNYVASADQLPSAEQMTIGTLTASTTPKDGGLVAFLFCREAPVRQGQRNIVGLIEGIQVRSSSAIAFLVYTHWIESPGVHEQRLTLELRGETREWVRRFTITDPLGGTHVVEPISIVSGPGYFADFKVYLDGQGVLRRVLPILGFGP